jgi:NAD(P)-dependent dehydrogenase (short-subunit alcohol dehydrogenase family)
VGAVLTVATNKGKVMAKVFVTGSSQGIGLMTGQLLAEQGHDVVFHARNEQRAQEMKSDIPANAKIVVGDVSTVAAMKEVAAKANEHGRFDAVIHNVGIGYSAKERTETADELTPIWAVNVLAPYVLTALMQKPKRLVYLSSGMHTMAHDTLDDIQWEQRMWNSMHAYCETKIQDLMLTFAIARRWPDVLSNAVTPGWVATRLGGPRATDDISQSHLTQAWLATSDDPNALVTGGYFRHKEQMEAKPAAYDTGLQDQLMAYCAQVSGIAMP